MISADINALILDLDGVLWTDNDPIGNLQEIFRTIKNRNLQVCLATNNSTRTPQQYLERLHNFGISDLEIWQVITSSLALAEELSKIFPEKGEVFTIGEIGLQVALQEAGFTVVTDRFHNSIVAVAVGIDRGINFNKLRDASLLIRSGVRFYGTNPDKTFPTPDGLIIGSGAIIGTLEIATDIKAIIIGKPAPAMFSLARKRMKVQPFETLVIGDRLETDILGGQIDGCKTALVLSGVSTFEEAKLWIPAPDYLAKDLSSLLEV